MTESVSAPMTSDDGITPDDFPQGSARSLGAIALLRAILTDLGGRRASVEGAGDDKAGKPTATLGAVIDRLDERAFGFMLLLLALPCCLPFVYLLPQIVALPMMALAAQLAIGRSSPWLPAKLAAREFEITGFADVLDRSARYVGWFEAFARPRLHSVTGPIGGRLVGLLLIAPCASILVPLPATNTVPGIGVAIASVGLIERDGLLTVLGLLIGLVWIGALLIFGLEAASLLKDWLAARF